MACAANFEDIFEKKSREELNCAICLKSYKSPRSLACLHTFCEGCIQSYITQTTGNGIYCPLCRGETMSPCPTKPRTEWARELPVNSSVKTMKAERQPHCNICEGFGKTTPAKTFCKECRQNQCDQCKALHSMVATTKGHTVVNIGDFPLEVTRMVNLGSIELCPEHRDKQVEFYCEDDKVLCCISCAFSKHRRCENVTEVAKLGQQMRDGNTPKQLDTHMEELEVTLRKIGTKVTGNASDLETKAEGIPRKMVNIRNQVMGIMDQLVASVTSKCGHLKKECTTEMDVTITSIHSIKAAITTARSQLQFLLKHGTETHMFIVLHKLEEQVGHYETQVKELQENTKTVELYLDIDLTLKGIVDSSKHLTANVTTDFTRINMKIPMTRCDLKVSSPTEIPRKGQRYEPEYRGLTCLPDGRLVVIDCSNCLCILLNDKFNVEASVKLDNMPADVATIGPKGVIVALPDAKRLQRIQVEDASLSRTGFIWCKLKPYRVSMYKDKQLLVGCDKGLWIIGFDGTVKTWIAKDWLSFGWPDYVVANSEKEHFFCSIYEQKRVYCLNLAGDILQIVDTALKNPCGIVLDSDGNLYVCSRCTHTVHQFDHAGQYIRMVNPGISHPYILCFQPAGDVMTVMSLNGSVSKVRFMRD